MRIECPNYLVKEKTENSKVKGLVATLSDFESDISNEYEDECSHYMAFAATTDKVIVESASDSEDSFDDEVGEDYRKELFAVITWSLWNRRNAIHFGWQAHPLSQICIVASSLLQEFLAIQVEDQSKPRPILQQQWRPPDWGTHNINFDAAVFGATDSARIGVIVRDWRGEPVRALSMAVPMANLVSDLEVVACRRAVNFEAELGLHSVTFEGDSAIVINVVSQGNVVLATYENIVEDIRSLSSSFLSWFFTYVHRSGNVVADFLAKKARYLDGCQLWTSTMPEDIMAVASFDVL
ncbi:uncharacterized protein LOC126700716 [Quercus robur]|uniref:uncharacterized protein LOC126700716 n=1 Tax=Quercus robur TaxID=38942 RepID=UPI002163C921|nr:uncharacterized protein LOC126700716 [Quercus robur]